MYVIAHIKNTLLNCTPAFASKPVPPSVDTEQMLVREAEKLMLTLFAKANEYAEQVSAK